MQSAAQLTARFLAPQVPPPPVVQRRGTEIAVTLNFNPTLPEIILMTFVKGAIQCSFLLGCTFHYVGNSEAMQNEFNPWVKETFPRHNFTPEQLKLPDLVTSIWSKTMQFVNAELEAKNDQEAIKNEKDLQSQAAQQETKFHAAGRLGKVFTSRQANFILASLASIERGVQ